jgi:hypothetical protein
MNDDESCCGFEIPDAALLRAIKADDLCGQAEGVSFSA